MVFQPPRANRLVSSYWILTFLILIGMRSPGACALAPNANYQECRLLRLPRTPSKAMLKRHLTLAATYICPSRSISVSYGRVWKRSFQPHDILLSFSPAMFGLWPGIFP